MDKRRAGRWAALALVAVPVASWPVAPAVAASCDELSGSLRIGAQQSRIGLSLPVDQFGTAVVASDLTIRQGANKIPVLDIRPSSPESIDVAVVVDTSARPLAASRAGEEVAVALLKALPRAVDVAVVTSGGAPQVAHPLDEVPTAAITDLRRAVVGGENALADSAILAANELGMDSARQQHIVVVAGGPDAVSLTPWSTVQRILLRRGIAVEVVDVSPDGSALPAAGAQCPGPVAAGAETAAGESVAARILDRRQVVLPRVDPARPLVVTLHSGASTATTVLAGRDEQSTLPTKQSGPSGGAGIGTLLLAFVVGILGLAALLVVIVVRSDRTGTSRRALATVTTSAFHYLRERSLADESRLLPHAELSRRWHDAWADLEAALENGPTSLELAEVAAYAEHAERHAVLVSESARIQRQMTRERSVERRRRAIRRAHELMAVERARRDRSLLEGEPADLDIGFGIDYHARSAERIATHRALSEELVRLVEASSRRAEAERAAAEALLVAREAEEAVQSSTLSAHEGQHAADAVQPVPTHATSALASPPGVGESEVDVAGASEDGPMEIAAAARPPELDLRHNEPAVSARSGSTRPGTAAPVHHAPDFAGWSLPASRPGSVAVEALVDRPILTTARVGGGGVGDQTPLPHGDVELRQPPSEPTDKPAAPVWPMLRLVNRGSPVVHATRISHAKRVRVAEVTSVLMDTRSEKQVSSENTDGMIARLCLIPLVPLLLSIRLVVDRTWLSSALDSHVSVLVLFSASGLTLLGAWWVVRVTTPPFRLRRPPTLQRREEWIAAQAAAERLAVRSAAGNLSNLEQYGTTASTNGEAGYLGTIASEDAVAAAARYQLAIAELDGTEGRVARAALTPFVLCILPALVLVGLV